MARPTDEDLEDVERWASQLDELWVLIPRRDALARTRGISGYGERHRMGETLFVLVGEVRRLRGESARLGEALAFAASAIKSGEPWTPACEEVIGTALEGPADDDAPPE